MSADRKSFVSRLFQIQGSALMRYLTARVRSASDAQDIAQETYLRLLRLDRIDLVRDPQAYLFRVAANLAREHQLKRVRGTQSIHDTAEGLWNDMPEALEDVVDRQSQLIRMNRILATLDPRHRAVLLLHRRDGLTYEEIAQELDISFHTVKKYLGIALSACREALPVRDKEAS